MKRTGEDRVALPAWLNMSALALAVLLVLTVTGYAILRGATYSNDFKNPYRVARVFWQTAELDIKSEPRYPPTIRVLLAPLAALPIGLAATIWALGSLVALATLPRLLARLSGIAVRAQPLAWLAVLPFLLDGFVLGQSDPINLLLVTAGLLLARQARPVLGAGLIGLAGMIKVLPLIFWGVLVARRRARGAVLGAVITATTSVVLLTAFAGWHAGVHSLIEWRDGLRKSEGPWGLIVTGNSLRENNESLPVVLARTFGDVDPSLTRNAVSLARLPLSSIWAVWLLALGMMAAVWLVWGWRARGARPERAWLGMFALTAILMLAMTPIAWPHYFAWLLPATLFLSGRPRLLLGVAVWGQLGMMSATLRGLGCHMVLALVLFLLVAHDLPTSALPPSRPRG